jgi:hypothetical protein
MVRDNSKTADEAQIRRLIDRWAGAIRDKNIEAAVCHYARDILLYDLAPPLVHRGVPLDVIRGAITRNPPEPRRCSRKGWRP